MKESQNHAVKLTIEEIRWYDTICINFEISKNATLYTMLRKIC